jgi:hypothetical protein
VAARLLEQLRIFVRTVRWPAMFSVVATIICNPRAICDNRACFLDTAITLTLCLYSSTRSSVLQRMKRAARRRFARRRASSFRPEKAGHCLAARL